MRATHFALSLIVLLAAPAAAQDDEDLDFSLGTTGTEDADTGEATAGDAVPETPPATTAEEPEPAAASEVPITEQSGRTALSEGQKRRVLASLAYIDPSLPPQRVAEMEHVLKQAMLGRPDVDVLDLRRALEPNSGADARRLVADAEARLAAGKSAYENLEADQAVEQLTQACERFETGYAAVQTPDKMVEAHVFLASVLLQTGSLDKARIHYRTALYLDPKLDLDPNRFAPEDIEALEIVRREIIQEETGSADITSAPVSARVYIDGVYRGTTPVKVTDLPRGYHYLLVERDGYERIAGVVEITPRRSQNFEQNLIALRRFADLQRSLASVNPDANDLGGTVETLRNVLPGDGFVLLTARMRADGVGLDARVHYVDFESGHRLRHSDGQLPLNATRAVPALRALVDDAMDLSKGVEDAPRQPLTLVVEDTGEPIEIPWMPILAGAGGVVVVGAVAAGVVFAVGTLTTPSARPLSGGGRVAVLGF
ncbi:MAG: PEGA domain-containing protein [Pseudomonadota bacterium]